MPDRRRPRRARWVVGGVLAGLLTTLAWALSAPLASSPDDNFHLPSIWCSHGYADDRCEEVPGEPDARSVPAQASVAVTCYVFNPLQSAACADDVMSDTAARGVVEHGNWDQRDYPPVYYWLTGWFVSGDEVASVVMIRAFTGAVVIGLSALLLLLVPIGMRPAAGVPLLVSSVPLGLSILGSTNPSAWGIAGPAALWLALHAAYASEGRRRQALCGVAVVAAVVGAGARADACLFSAMAVVLAMILNWGRLRSQLLPTVTAVVVLVFSTVLFLRTAQAVAVTSGLDSAQVEGPASGMSNLELTLANLGQLPTLWTGFLGTTPIGWLDTPMPAVVSFLSIAALTVFLTLSWRRAPRPHQIALALSGAALFVYPLYILGRSHLTVGQGVQPRYLLPLAVIFIGLVVLTGGARLTRVQAWVIAGALAVAHAVSLHVQLRRYVTGLDVSNWNLDRKSEWWWDIAVGPTVVWVVGSLAFAWLAFTMLRLCVRDRALQPTE